jgi:hypothetical protein
MQTTSGRITVIVAGAPSKLHVALDAVVHWRLPSSNSWTMKPALILPKSVRAQLAPPMVIIDEAVGRERNGARSGYSSLVIETTACPSMAATALSNHPSVFSEGINDVRLIAGSGEPRQDGATTLIPVVRLCGEFHEAIETRGPDFMTAEAGGRPAPSDLRMTGISFSAYEEGERILDLSSVKSALAAAADLRAPRVDGDAEEVISTPRHAVAAALMLTLWAAQNRAPYAAMASSPWQSRGALRRNVGGVV